MTITFKGGAVFVKRAIKGEIIERGLGISKFRTKAIATLEPNNDPLQDKVTFTLPRMNTFVGPQIKASVECRDMNIGWDNPNDAPQRHPPSLYR